ncbi:MAG: hypothetical protein AAGF44_09150 [Pseudomonadota bacterium]
MLDLEQMNLRRSWADLQVKYSKVTDPWTIFASCYTRADVVIEHRSLRIVPACGLWPDEREAKIEAVAQVGEMAERGCIFAIRAIEGASGFLLLEEGPKLILTGLYRRSQDSRVLWHINGLLLRKPDGAPDG